MEQLTFRCRLDCTCEEDFERAKYLCEKASEAKRGRALQSSKRARKRSEDCRRTPYTCFLWSVLTAESSTPLLEFDYFGEDEDVFELAFGERARASRPKW